jgi:ABC-type oligopeptide transport system substrate-binding subunit
MTSRPSTALLAVALAAAALAAGCAPQTTTSSNSVSKFRGDQRAAAQTVEDLQAAADDSNETKICSQVLAKALADRLAAANHGCPAAVNEAIKDADSTDMTVEAVRVTGNRATARVKFETGKKDRRANIALVREGGGWRIAGF